MFGLVLGWMLRWGGWYHAAWVLPGGEWWEYIPDEETTRGMLNSKGARLMPPLIFVGKDSKIEKR